MPDASSQTDRRARCFRSPRSVATFTLIAGVAIMGVKFGVFALTRSAAVFSDAMESIVNLLAAGMAIFSTWYAARPPDREHPYGHGKIEFMAVGAEGAMVLIAGIAIAAESTRRLIVGVELRALDLGSLLQVGVSLLVGGLAWFVWGMGRRLDSPTLIADGKHLMTDTVSTIGVAVALLLVHLTGYIWLDFAIAWLLAVFILMTGGRLVAQSFAGLMDRMDLADDAAVRAILDEEIGQGRILGYHKVRHRHTGPYHWVDLHIQVPGGLTVRDAHKVASHVEHRIEQCLGRANATAHVEPPESILPPDQAP